MHTSSFSKVRRGNGYEPTCGLDIGGTKMRWVVMKGRAVVLAKEIPTPRDRKEFVSKLDGLLMGLRGNGIQKIGFSVAGLIGRTRILKSPNLSFLAGFDFKPIAARIGFRIGVDNDAKCFARAEIWAGGNTYKNFSKMLALTLGTGIGRAVARRGIILSERRLELPEVWEKEYQRRSANPTEAYARFVANKLVPLILEIKPQLVIIGGGKMRLPAFFHLLRLELRKTMPDVIIHRSHYRQNAAAIGAALLMRQ